MFGTIKYKFAKGALSCLILNKILKEHQALGMIKSKENETLRPDTPMYLGYEDDVKGGEIEALILIDRQVDMITPFCI